MTVVWEGASALHPFLVAIGDLEPFGGNPRRGDVSALIASLGRFGQVRPITVDGGGVRIVAGHHIALAAAELGWTHIAALPNEFDSDDEARAYLVADNRLHDIGYGYDHDLLVAQLQAIAATDAGLEGTGYTDLDSYLTEVLATTHDPAVRSGPQSARSGPHTPTDPVEDLVEIPLLIRKTQRKDFEAWLEVIKKERGTTGTTDTVVEGVRLAAVTLNQG